MQNQNNLGFRSKESDGPTLIYDPNGCKGKSTIARLAQLHHGALHLPPVNDHKELLQAACDILMAKENLVWRLSIYLVLSLWAPKSLAHFHDRHRGN